MATFAPPMSRRQFLKVRPQGQYQNYLAFLQRRRSAVDPSYQVPGMRVMDRPPPTRVRVTPQPTYASLLRQVQSTFLTPAQQMIQARKMAATDYTYQQKYAQAETEARQHMMAMAAAGRAAAAMNAGLIGQVGGQYQAGADQLAALGGLGGMVSGAVSGDVAAANASLGNVGAPAVTEGGPVGAPGIAGPAQAGVETYRGVTLPGQMLTNAGGYASAGMAGEIAAQNL